MTGSMHAFPLSYEVIIDPGTEHPATDAVSFRTGPPISGEPVYDDLSPFWWDLVAGRPLPLKFVTRRIDDERTLIAMALFLYRDLATHPRMSEVLVASDFWRVQPDWGLAHVDRDLGRFLILLRDYVRPSGLDRKTLGDRMVTAITWIRKFVTEDWLPSLPLVPMPTVLDVGTNGFVVASTTGSLDDGWLDLFRMGHLRGVLVRERQDGLLDVLIARKSRWATLDLNAAAEALNEVSASRWAVRGNRLPGEGVSVPLPIIIQILCRC